MRGIRYAVIVDHDFVRVMVHSRIDGSFIREVVLDDSEAAAVFLLLDMVTFKERNDETSQDES